MKVDRAARNILRSLIYFVLPVIVSGCSSGMKRQFKSSHFVFIYNSHIDKKQALSVDSALEANYLRISRDLQTEPADPIEVSIYSNRWTYATTHGHWTSGGNIEGTGKLHFLRSGWDEKNIYKIAVHEFSHAVMLKLLIDREPKPLPANFDAKFSKFPTWLYEAIAVYEAGQFEDPKTLPFLADNKYPPLAEFNDRSKGQKIYSVGYTMIEYILQQYGRNKFIELIAAYGNLKILGVADDQFMQGWYAFVKAKYLH